MIAPVVLAAQLAASIGLALPALPTSAQGELVVQKTGTKEYHRPGCPVIRDGRGVVALTRAQAEARGLAPHDDCDPEKAPPPGAGGEKPAPAPPTFVFVDEDGRHYHRDTCTRLGANAKKVRLEEAGRKYWPCPECKPPIRPRPPRS